MKKRGGRGPGVALHFPLAANSLTSKYMAANPAKSTPLSSITERLCNRSNPTRSGLSAAVAWIDPISVRSFAILGVTPCCDTTVSAIISTTHSATGAAKLANVRVLSSRAAKITMPQTTPMKCIRPSANPTIAPAWSRLPSRENAPGATTKLKKTSLPSHKLKPRNSIVRRTVDIKVFR
jgi:hypothetical protein